MAKVYFGSLDIMFLVFQVVLKWWLYEQHVRHESLSVNSYRCIPLPNLVVISLMKMEISILISILTCILWKKLNSLPRSIILIDFENQENDLQFGGPGHDYQKSNHNKKHTGYREASWVSSKRGKLQVWD